MSTHENYDRISATYDATTRAFGCCAIREYLKAHHRLPVRRLADVGCGTGNYAVALNDAACSVIGCDLSFGMLTVARLKRSAGGHLGLAQCDIGFRLPFQSETLDVVTCIQVLHHLDEPGHNYSRHWQLMSEVSRVLSRGGLLIVNTITHDQLRDGVWWAS